MCKNGKFFLSFQLDNKKYLKGQYFYEDNVKLEDTRSMVLIIASKQITPHIIFKKPRKKSTSWRLYVQFQLFHTEDDFVDPRGTNLCKYQWLSAFIRAIN